MGCLPNSTLPPIGTQVRSRVPRYIESRIASYGTWRINGGGFRMASVPESLKGTLVERNCARRPDSPPTSTRLST